MFLANCLGQVSSLVDPALTHLLCLSVRNLENPRETMGIELYFDTAEIPLVVSMSSLNALRQRADDSKLLVEGWDNFTVELPTLDGLLDAIGAPRLEEIMEQAGTLARWRYSSVQRHVGGSDGTRDGLISETDGSDEAESGEWITLYEQGNLVEADKMCNANLDQRIRKKQKRPVF